MPVKGECGEAQDILKMSSRFPPRRQGTDAGPDTSKGGSLVTAETDRARGMTDTSLTPDAIAVVARAAADTDRHGCEGP